MSQQTLKVKIKKFVPEAQIPEYIKVGDSGMDMTATSKELDEYNNVIYGTGIGISLPEGYCALILPRSSNAKKDLILSNSVGLIDSNFVGEIMFKFKVIAAFDLLEEHSQLDNYDMELREYSIGDRIGQLLILPYPKIEFKEVEELPSTERGGLGFGSSGN